MVTDGLISSVASLLVYYPKSGTEQLIVLCYSSCTKISFAYYCFCSTLFQCFQSPRGLSTPSFSRSVVLVCFTFASFPFLSNPDFITMPRNKRRLDIDIRETLKVARYERNKRPLAASTEYQYRSDVKLWCRYASLSVTINRNLSNRFRYLKSIGCRRSEALKTLIDGADLPSQDTLKSFLKWYALTSWGQLDEDKKPSKRTVEHKCHKITTLLQRETGKSMNLVQFQDLIGFIRGHLSVDCRIKNISQERTYSDEVDLDVLLQQLWCNDVRELHWNRLRIQITLLLHIHAFLAVRPGAILPTPYYPEVCLKYMVSKACCSQKNNPNM